MYYIVQMDSMNRIHGRRVTASARRRNQRQEQSQQPDVGEAQPSGSPIDWEEELGEMTQGTSGSGGEGGGGGGW